MIESGHVRDYRGMTRAQLAMLGEHLHQRALLLETRVDLEAMHLHEALMGELRVLGGVLLSRGRCDA